MAKPGRGRPATPSGSGSGSSSRSRSRSLSRSPSRSRSRSRSYSGSGSHSSSRSRSPSRSRSRSRSSSSSSSPSRSGSSRSRSPPPPKKRSAFSLSLSLGRRFSSMLSAVMILALVNQWITFSLRISFGCPVEGAKRGRSPPPQSKKVSPPPSCIVGKQTSIVLFKDLILGTGALCGARKESPIPESVVLHVDHLSRNVNENHLKEIFGMLITSVSLHSSVVSAMGVLPKNGVLCKISFAGIRIWYPVEVNLPKGFGYVEFKNRADAEKAQLYMDGAQIDGKVVQAKFTLPERKKPASPPKAIASTSKKDAARTDGAGPDADKDGPKRQREASPRRKPPSPSRRRSPPGRRGSPRREVNSPLRRRVDSPVRRRPGSPYRRGDSPPPRRRLASPVRGRSPSSPPRRYRSPPRASPRRMRGSPVRRRSPLPPRRRSPHRARSPPRRSPIRRRSRSPIRRPIRSRSRSLSPRRGRAPAARRGRSSSYSSSPSPRKAPRRVSRSRSPRRPLRGRRSSSNSSGSSGSPAPAHSENSALSTSERPGLRRFWNFGPSVKLKTYRGQFINMEKSCGLVFKTRKYLGEKLFTQGSRRRRRREEDEEDKEREDSCGKLKKDTFCVEISHLLLSSVILIFGGALHSVASLGDPMNCLKLRSLGISMAGNGLPDLGRVKLSDLVPSEGLPSDAYKLSVTTLSQSLAQYSAAIIQLPASDGALLRSCLESARPYFHQRETYPTADMIHPDDSRDWCKTSGYRADPQLWYETYDFRPGLTPVEPANEMEFPPAGLLDIFALLGRAARDILDAISFFLNLRSSPFTEILDNVPLRNREISSSVLSVCCHGRPSFQVAQHHNLTTQEDGQLVMFSDQEHQVDRSLITLVKSDKAGLHVRDFHGRWIVVDGNLGPQEAIVYPGLALYQATAGYISPALHRVDINNLQGNISGRCSLAFKLMPKSMTNLNCAEMRAAGHGVEAQFNLPVPVDDFMQRSTDQLLNRNNIPTFSYPPAQDGSVKPMMRRRKNISRCKPLPPSKRLRLEAQRVLKERVQDMADKKGIKLRFCTLKDCESHIHSLDSPCAKTRMEIGWPPGVPFVHPHDLPNKAKIGFLETYEPGWSAAHDMELSQIEPGQQSQHSANCSSHRHALKPVFISSEDNYSKMMIKL
ncbi:hypothetical protein M9H77_14944 [Catharanthus roseus]|uniref:Uncharacterized protein n=1 Tax=Catharanthus roseus TaxID=4058 RepID=A0ACC0BPL8_CATRO|nr:hypothetical protein M9H77_14944 [Catharanthus roseus]